MREALKRSLIRDNREKDFPMNRATQIFIGGFHWPGAARFIAAAAIISLSVLTVVLTGPGGGAGRRNSA